MSEQTKLCIDCEHHGYRGYHQRCWHPDYLSVVDGLPLFDCHDMRYHKGFCGNNASLFVLKKPDPKRPWYWRLTRLWSDKY